MSTVEIDYTPVRNESTMRKNLRRKQKYFFAQVAQARGKCKAVEGK